MDQDKRGRWGRGLLAGLRLGMAWIFLWAFLDKLFGLGFATARENAWLRGGSPTAGFLRFGTKGPFKPAFESMADSVVVEWLFMVGLFGIGLALALGIGMRIAAGSGALLMMLMWLAALPPSNNPFLDDHWIYAGLLVLLAIFDAGRYAGLAAWWRAKAPVANRPWLW